MSSDERREETVIELSIDVDWLLTGAGFVLLLVQSHQCQAVEHYLECNDKPSTLCLTQGYSTFELPLRNKPNLIKIGESHYTASTGWWLLCSAQYSRLNTKLRIINEK